MTDRIEAIRARHAARLRTRAAKGDGSVQMSTLVDDDMRHLFEYIDRLLEAINEYDPADHLHEILDIDPTDPVNARAHRLAHERMMGEWHDRVVGRDRIISLVKAALTQGITTDKAARGAAIRVIDDWLNRDLDALAELVAPDAEPGGAS